jgi:hypothetical protein
MFISVLFRLQSPGGNDPRENAATNIGQSEKIGPGARQFELTLSNKKLFGIPIW